MQLEQQRHGKASGWAICWGLAGWWKCGLIASLQRLADTYGGLKALGNPNNRNNEEKKRRMIEKIRATLYLKKLDEHIVKGTAMEQSQVHAALKLLNKVLPDLKATEHSGEVGGVTSIHLHI